MGFCPRDFITTSSSSLEIVPLPSLSKSENASRNSVQEKSSEQSCLSWIRSGLSSFQSFVVLQSKYKLYFQRYFNVLPLICSSVSWRSTWQKKNAVYRIRANKSVNYEKEKPKYVSKTPDLAVLQFTQVYGDTPL